MRSWIKGFFDGTNSSMRLVLIYPVLAVTTVWIIVSLYKMVLQDIPLGLGGFVLALVVGKVGQTVFEKKSIESFTQESSKTTTPQGATTEKQKTIEERPAPAPEVEE